MNLRKSLIIARKELFLIRKKKILILSFILVPLVFAMLIPIVLIIALHYHDPLASVLSSVEPLQFLFVLVAYIPPLITATYSIVGEKLEQSLEPLLATPTSDREILLGKDLGTMIPAISSLFLGALVYMVLVDALSYGQLGYLFMPTWGFAVTIMLDAPLAAYFITRLSIILSAKSKSVQSAQAYGRVILIILMVPVWLSYLGAFSLISPVNLLVIGGILLVACVVLYYLSSAKFNREEILTRWK